MPPMMKPALGIKTVFDAHSNQLYALQQRELLMTRESLRHFDRFNQINAIEMVRKLTILVSVFVDNNLECDLNATIINVELCNLQLEMNNEDQGHVDKS